MSGTGQVERTEEQVAPARWSGDLRWTRNGGFGGWFHPTAPPEAPPEGLTTGESTRRKTDGTGRTGIAQTRTEHIDPSDPTPDEMSRIETSDLSTGKPTTDKAAGSNGPAPRVAAHLSQKRLTLSPERIRGEGGEENATQLTQHDGRDEVKAAPHCRHGVFECLFHHRTSERDRQKCRGGGAALNLRARAPDIATN